jgi:rhodanese-related sulfurtransferase
MSWNAARRLRALGYTDVRWLAEGTDGWREAGLPLVEARPEGE